MLALPMSGPTGVSADGFGLASPARVTPCSARPAASLDLCQSLGFGVDWFRLASAICSAPCRVQISLLDALPELTRGRLVRETQERPMWPQSSGHWPVCWFSLPTSRKVLPLGELAAGSVAPLGRTLRPPSLWSATATPCGLASRAAKVSPRALDRCSPPCPPTSQLTLRSPWQRRHCRGGSSEPSQQRCRHLLLGSWAPHCGGVGNGRMPGGRPLDRPDHLLRSPRRP